MAPAPQPMISDTTVYDTMQVELVEDTIGEFPVYDLVQIGTSEVGATVQSNKIVYEYSKVPENIDLRFKDGILYQVIFDKKAVEERQDATNVRLLLNPKRVKILGKRVTTSFISRYYGVPLNKIKEYNPGININKIQVGQILNLECNCNSK